MSLRIGRPSAGATCDELPAFDAGERDSGVVTWRKVRSFFDRRRFFKVPLDGLSGEHVMTEVLSHEEARSFIRLCETGRLYAIEEWIRAGRPILVPKDFRKTPLRVALKTGFHSLIELLLRHEDNPHIKNDFLKEALQIRRRDLVELAVEIGADMGSVSFADVLYSWDRTLATFFLEHGADPIKDVPFAWAFCDRIRTALGSYLDCKRNRPELAAQLQEQADIALRHFAREGNLKWVSLLVWAGADPRSKGPMLEYLDDREMDTTALHEASVSGHLEVLKRLKPDPSHINLSELLESAAMFAHKEMMAYLIGLGARLNDKANGGSSALDNCLRHLSWEDFDRIRYGGRHYQSPAYKVSKTRDAIRLLVEHGALWNPGDSLNDVRRSLYRIDPEVTVELAGLFLKYHACDDTTLRDLLRPSRMQQHLAPAEQGLWRAGLTLEGRRRSDVKDASPSPYVLERYDRQQLYREVWSEPTRDVASRYGISDVRLAKVCRLLQVPKPPRGYWAKKAAGQPVGRRPKLPSISSHRRQ